jgi:PKD repeat protein
MSKILTPFERNLKEQMADYEMPYEQRSWFMLQRQMNAVNAGHYPWIVALVATILVTAGGAVTIYRHRHIPSAAISASVDQRFNNHVAFNGHSAISSRKFDQANYANLQDLNSSDQMEMSSTVALQSNNLSASNLSNQSTPLKDSNSTNNQTGNISDLGNWAPVQNNAVAPVKTSTPKPEDVIAFDAPVRKACVGEEIEFKVTQGPESDDGYLWDFGDNHFDKDKRTPKHKFMKAGTYDVALSITNSKGQITTAVSNDLITILDSPDAQFRWEFINTDPSAPEIKIIDNSENATAYTWTLADGVQSTDKNPSFKLKPYGKQNISLHVINENGCTDVIVKQISVNSDFKLDAPQSFTTGSGVFMPKGLKDSKVNFVLTILDKNDNQIYQTSSRIKGWDGKLPNGTYAMPGESFYWKVVIENDLTKEQKYFNGTINVSP